MTQSFLRFSYSFCAPLSTHSQTILVPQMLNNLGYGREGSGLQLDLVYNPGGAFLAPAQAKLEGAYKQELRENFGIEFNQLYCLNNMPIKRFADFLQVRTAVVLCAGNCAWLGKSLNRKQVNMRVANLNSRQTGCKNAGAAFMVPPCVSCYNFNCPQLSGHIRAEC